MSSNIYLFLNVLASGISMVFDIFCGRLQVGGNVVCGLYFWHALKFCSRDILDMREDADCREFGLIGLVCFLWRVLIFACYFVHLCKDYVSSIRRFVKCHRYVFYSHLGCFVFKRWISKSHISLVGRCIAPVESLGMKPNAFRVALLRSLPDTL